MKYKTGTEKDRRKFNRVRFKSGVTDTVSEVC
jgi:hypothetical protein